MYFNFNKVKSIYRFISIIIIVVIIKIIVIIRIIQISEILSEKKIRAGNKKILRGSILDRRGIALAITEEASTISINPQEVIDPGLVANFLSGYLEMDPNSILQKIYLNQNKNYVLLKRKIDNYTAELIMDLNLSGVYRNFEYKRIYPANHLASNLIGFVRLDTLQGMSGIELMYDDILSISNDQYTGYSITLTIDSLIQYELEKTLMEFYKISKAKRVIGIMMDLETGEILAMVNLPNYNPNTYYNEDVSNKRNWAIQLPLEPGSVMKPLFAAMLINEIKDILEHKVICKGEFRFKTGSVRCLRRGKIEAHGLVDLEKIIEMSCNVGIIEFAKLLPPESVYKYLLELGFHQNTNIVPNKWEHIGYIPKLDNWLESTIYYLPIGQGLLVTPIQLITAFNVLVNNGILLKPILIKKIESEDKKYVEITKKEAKNTSFRKKTLDIIKKYLLKVTKSGTGKLASVGFLDVMGKTGTSQKFGPSGYLNLSTVSFIGAFPYPDPKYSVLIIFDEVLNEFSGGNLAAPAFSKFLNNIKDIVLSPYEVVDIPINQKIKIEDVENNQKRFQNVENFPDFNNLTLKDFLYWKETILDTQLRNKKIDIEIYGNGYIIKQYPEPGTSIKFINKIQIYLSKDNF